MSLLAAQKTLSCYGWAVDSFMTSFVTFKALESRWINLCIHGFVSLRQYYRLSTHWAEQMLTMGLQVLVNNNNNNNNNNIYLYQKEKIKVIDKI